MKIKGRYKKFLTFTVFSFLVNTSMANANPGALDTLQSKNVTTEIAEIKEGNVTSLERESILTELQGMDFDAVLNQENEEGQLDSLNALKTNLEAVKAEHQLTDNDLIDLLMNDLMASNVDLAEIQEFADYAKEFNISDQEKINFYASVMDKYKVDGASFSGDDFLFGLSMVALVGALVYLALLAGGSDGGTTTYYDDTFPDGTPCYYGEYMYDPSVGYNVDCGDYYVYY